MKKFENFKSNLSILSKANNEDLENEFIISGIIALYVVSLSNTENVSDVENPVI